jgi:Kef-type K+ transport system membrane component KefB
LETCSKKRVYFLGAFISSAVSALAIITCAIGLLVYYGTSIDKIVYPALLSSAGLYILSIGITTPYAMKSWSQNYDSSKTNLANAKFEGLSVIICLALTMISTYYLTADTAVHLRETTGKYFFFTLGTFSSALVIFGHWWLFKETKEAH